MTQGHVLKAWKDYLAKKDFDMTSNVLSLRFIQANKHETLQGCFDAIKNNMQNRKARIIKEALNQDMNVSLKDTTDYLHSVSFVLQKRYRK